MTYRLFACGSSIDAVIMRSVQRTEYPRMEKLQMLGMEYSEALTV